MKTKIKFTKLQADRGVKYFEENAALIASGVRTMPVRSPEESADRAACLDAAMARWSPKERIARLLAAMGLT